jgi:hypothetical protein
VRQQLRVDIQLPHPPRDELGELAAEVQHHDRLAALVGRAGRLILRRSIRTRRLQRGLEVGLHFRVVGGEDPVAGIRGRTVDGLAALSPTVG